MHFLVDFITIDVNTAESFDIIDVGAFRRFEKKNFIVYEKFVCNAFSFDVFKVLNEAIGTYYFR